MVQKIDEKMLNGLKKIKRTKHGMGKNDSSSLTPVRKLVPYILANIHGGNRLLKKPMLRQK
jgi:hypothetical protein